jgi:hypothetical protein
MKSGHDVVRAIALDNGDGTHEVIVRCRTCDTIEVSKYIAWLDERGLRHVDVVEDES